MGGTRLLRVPWRTLGKDGIRDPRPRRPTDQGALSQRTRFNLPRGDDRLTRSASHRSSRPGSFRRPALEERVMARLLEPPDHRAPDPAVAQATLGFDPGR